MCGQRQGHTLWILSSLRMIKSGEILRTQAFPALYSYIYIIQKNR